ncbi:MAG: hypothetical protein Q4C22_08065 [Bacillota bacterium]|nr:hypothetical protein [Bacillota bacterium]
MGQDPDLDLDTLWHLVFEEGEAIRGSFNLLRSGSALRQVSEKTFTVEAASPIMERYAKDNARALEELMEKQLGRPLRMECISRKEDGGKQESMEELAEQIGARLGINVEIQ